MTASSSTKPTTEFPLRLRVFAGPNGSGKTTIINAVKNHKINGRKIDFGYYINADDIAKKLREGVYSFDPFDVSFTESTFIDFAEKSGLINAQFSIELFKNTFQIAHNKIQCRDIAKVEHLAQLIARFLREQLLNSKKRFSFETVFSHPSNMEVMKRAAEMGYKVYLYFVSTESAEINKFRVKLRVKKGGHDVPEDKIESRYKRSLDLLFEASQITYQTFFFDNSKNDEPYKLFARFKQVDGKKNWEAMQVEKIPMWFRRYYEDKIKGK